MKRSYLLFAVMLLGLSFAGLSVDDYSLSPQVVEPGDSGVLEITISNGADSDTVENVAITVSSASTLGIDRSFLVGDLEAKSSVVVSLPFTASENVTSGYYVVEVHAVGRTKEYYLDSNNQLKSKTETFEKSASIPIQIVEQPVISVAISEKVVDELTQEEFVFTNSGGDAKRIQVTILNDGIGFSNMGKVYLASLEDEATVSATLDARGAEDGAAKLRLQLTYYNEIGTEQAEVMEIPITVKKGGGNFLFVQDGAMLAGENGKLDLELTNVGPSVSDLSITSGTDGVSLKGLNEYTLGDLAEGETTTFELSIVSDLDPGTQNVEFDLSWEENGEERSGSVTIPIKVIPDSAISVYLEAKTTPLAANSENTLSVTVSNLGVYDIQGTTLRIESEAFTLETIQAEQFMGELESDDFSSVQYDITVENVPAGEYPVLVTVSFRDASGEWSSVEREIPITVRGFGSSMSESGMGSRGGLNIPVIAGTVAIGAGAYWLWKKRKKKSHYGG
ncbi:hypothetical protein JW721_04560 [Candidatus Micrarchaeota archaeon]|nr:hypothetical protein [Candidatus Micrarchaeota archaeon]